MNWNQPPERRRETNSTTITYEPVFEHEGAQDASQAAQRRRDSWLDAGHRSLFVVAVAVVVWVGLKLFYHVPSEFGVMAFVVATVFVFWPMLADVNHRNRQSAAKRALHDLGHAVSWEREALALERSRHSRDLFGIESQTQFKQLAHRVEQRALVSGEQADMDAQHFVDAIARGESPSKRNWTGRTLPSGSRMTAQRWSEITAQLEADGQLTRDGPGTGYRLSTVATAPSQAAAIDDNAICSLPR